MAEIELSKFRVYTNNEDVTEKDIYIIKDEVARAAIGNAKREIDNIDIPTDAFVLQGETEGEILGLYSEVAYQEQIDADPVTTHYLPTILGSQPIIINKWNKLNTTDREGYRTVLYDDKIGFFKKNTTTVVNNPIIYTNERDSFVEISPNYVGLINTGKFNNIDVDHVYSISHLEFDMTTDTQYAGWGGYALAASRNTERNMVFTIPGPTEWVSAAQDAQATQSLIDQLEGVVLTYQTPSDISSGVVVPRIYLSPVGLCGKNYGVAGEARPLIKGFDIDMTDATNSSIIKGSSGTFDYLSATTSVLVNNMNFPSVTTTQGFSGNAASINLNTTTKNVDILVPAPNIWEDAMQTAKVYEEFRNKTDGIKLGYQLNETNPENETLPSIFLSPLGLVGEAGSNGIGNPKPVIKGFNVEIETLTMSKNEFSSILNNDLEQYIQTTTDTTAVNIILSLINIINNLDSRLAAIES